MFKPIPFANAAASVTVIFYVVFFLLSQLAPVAFRFLFNAQFFGADAVSLIRGGFSFDIGILISVAVSAWIGGYLFAWLYNYFLR